jgi:hypothetical protein
MTHDYKMRATLRKPSASLPRAYALGHITNAYLASPKFARITEIPSTQTSDMRQPLGESALFIEDAIFLRGSSYGKGIRI